MKKDKQENEWWKPGTWFRMPFSLFEVLRPSEAAVLAFLIHYRNRTRRGNEAFVCSVDTVTDHLFLTKRRQENAMASLCELNLIRISRQGGQYSRRLVELNDRKIARLLGVDSPRKEDESPRFTRPLKRTALATERGRHSPRKEDESPYARAKSNTQSNTQSDGLGKKRKEGLFQNGEANIQSFEQKMCDRLELHIRQTRKLFRTPNKKTWLHQIRELMKDLGGDQERLKRVLKWMTQTKPDKMLPEVHSAKQFREKFTRLEACMEKETSKGRVNTAGPMFDWEQRAYETLKDAGWAGASAQTLRFCVHASAENYEAHMNRVKAMTERLGPKHIVSRFVKATFYTLHSPTERFCVRWWQNVSKQLSKWRSFNGTLEQFVFSPDHRDFQKMGQTEAREYAGASTTLWQDYLNELNEN